jgi:hypothetical protein
MVIVAGMALGGYHVYKSVFDAVSGAHPEAKQLTNSLYFPGSGGFFAAFKKAHRFRDFQINSFCTALRAAFHLAVVAIMIVETITPRFYELIWPSGGIMAGWTQGAGRLILSAQNSYQYVVIAGCIWAVLFFDAICTGILDLALQRRFLRYYRDLT